MFSCGRLLLMLFAVSFMAGCAHIQSAAIELSQPELPDHWQAGPAPSINDLTSFQQLIWLDDSIQEELRRDQILTATADARIRFLMEHLLGSRQRPFLYRSNKTTPASVTYRNHAGNCLSLTLLAYAMADGLGFRADIQEVKTPQIWERRSSIDFVNRHVNIRLSRPAHTLQNGIDYSKDIVVDFEPSDNANQFRHRPVEQAEVVAMYFNNLGAEALVAGDFKAAFSYFRSATTVYERFESPWINLALLYQRADDFQTAEAVLRYARYLSSDNESALRVLYDLMVKLRRPEAATLLAEIHQREQRDPYFLLRKANVAMESQSWANARDYLLEAEKFAHGFLEIHESLAKVYLMLGENELASTQTEIAEKIVAEQVNAPVYVPVPVQERSVTADGATK